MHHTEHFSNDARFRRGEFRRRCGVVLIVVTIVLVLISLSAYGFVALMQTENKAAHLRGDQLQAESVAASGEEFLQALLELPRAQRASAGGLWENPGLFQGQVVDGQPSDTRQGRFCVLAPHWDESSQPFRFGVECESSKVHLGTILAWDKKTAGAGRTALMKLPGMTESVADALLDWIDEDSTPREFGAESDYYQGLNPPYAAANRLPQSLEELLLVKGVTRELLFGLDLNVNYRIDPFETELARSQNAQISVEQDSPSPSKRPWSSYLTVYSAERDESFDGRPKISLNHRDLTTLHQQLSAAFDPAWANFVVAFRQFGPYEGSGSGADASNFAFDPSRPSKFQIKSVFDLMDARVEVETSSSNSTEILASPIGRQSGSLQEDLPRLCDETTTGTEKVIRGRININTASREVLSMIPGLDAGVIERIMAARSMGEDSNGHRQRHAVWLLAEGLVDVPTMKRLEPYVTTGGDVVRAQIVAFYDEQSPWMRMESVLDSTRSPTRRVYYKNLRNLGRGFLLVQLAPTSDDYQRSPPSSGMSSTASAALSPT